MRLCPPSVLVIALAFLIPLCSAPAQTDPAADYAKIREGLSKLTPLVGKWNAVALFHSGDKVTEQDGTYDIGWALDETYLEFRVQLHRKNDPSRPHGFIIYLTYNPATQQYESTYFYTRWALRVSETGTFDAASKQFRTTAFIPREDGVHDENVRTISDLKNPNKIVYTHYSRYNNETAERMDLQITLTRESPR